LVLAGLFSSFDLTAQTPDDRLAEIRKEIDVLQRDLVDVKRTVTELKDMAQTDRRKAAPAEAWWALAAFGGLFAVCWGIVSMKRERVREQEVVLGAVVNALEVFKNADKELVDKLGESLRPLLDRFKPPL
jgi:hypothetical protein